MFILVDNPPVSTGDITWIETAPDITTNPAQAEAAMTVREACEPGPAEHVK